MGSDSTAKIQRVHASRSPSAASAKDVTQSQQPKRRKKKQDNEDSTGRKPPKNMAVAQARKILARKDLWGHRMLRKGFDPRVTAGAPPTASIIDFGGGGESTSYPISMDHALCDKLLGLEDLIAKPKHTSQARASSTHMTKGLPIAQEPNPCSNYIFPGFPFPSAAPSRSPNFDDRFLYYETLFPSTSRSPQPSETSEATSEVGSESICSADSFYAPSANGSLTDFDGPMDEWTGGEASAVVPSYWDPHTVEQTRMSTFSIGSAGPSAPDMQPFQHDWMTEYPMMASFQNPQAPTSFPFDHSNSVPQTTIFNFPTSVPYTVANTMASHNFTPF